MIRQDSSAVVVNRKGEVLLQFRSDFPIWCLPGGGKEGNETPVQTLVREVFEETGLHIRPERLVGVYTTDYFVANEQSYVFACRIMGGKLRIDAESKDLAFFNPRKLPEPLLYFHKEIIQAALAGEQNVKSFQKLSFWKILKGIRFNPVLAVRLFVVAIKFAASAKNI